MTRIALLAFLLSSPTIALSQTASWAVDVTFTGKTGNIAEKNGTNTRKARVSLNTDNEITAKGCFTFDAAIVSYSDIDIHLDLKSENNSAQIKAISGPSYDNMLPSGIGIEHANDGAKAAMMEIDAVDYAGSAYFAFHIHPSTNLITETGDTVRARAFAGFCRSSDCSGTVYTSTATVFKRVSSCELTS